MYSTIEVDLGDRSYPIVIGKGVLNDPELLLPYIHGKQVCIVSNETIAPLYLQRLLSLLVDEAIQVDSCLLPDGEQYKTLAVLEQVFDTLLEKKHHRGTTLIALGGGVIGDMTGFAAACYQRGVNFIQVPTTLLAQVDSSVGGKTAVNHPRGKNMIGAFYQPQTVLVDIDTLGTLPDREFHAGIAEVIKYGLIVDNSFYLWLQENISKVLAREEAALVHIIEASCRCKAAVVAEDEKEKGLRAILNLGHTFGHAIETAMGYGQWLHGEAVAAGMLLAAKLSAQLGDISTEDVSELEVLLRACSLPVALPEAMNTRQFLDLMMLDKKVQDHRLRLVLLKEIGSAYVTDQVSVEQVAACLDEAFGA